MRHRVFRQAFLIRVRDHGFNAADEMEVSYIT
jgi:hypothetical protein